MSDRSAALLSDLRVSAIDFAPEPIANAMVSAPASALAEAIASRSEPAPESFTLLTVNVENRVRDSRQSNPPTARTAGARSIRRSDKRFSADFRIGSTSGPGFCDLVRKMARTVFTKRTNGYSRFGEIFDPALKKFAVNGIAVGFDDEGTTFLKQDKSHAGAQKQ